MPLPGLFFAALREYTGHADYGNGVLGIYYPNHSPVLGSVPWGIHMAHEFTCGAQT